MSGVDTDDLKERLGICIFSLDAWYFDDDTCRKELREHFHVTNLEGLGISDYDSGIIAAGALFLYLKETQKTALSQMTTIRPYTAERYMLIDSSSRRNLELVETLREKQKRGSLLWVLDKTKTAMGARTLRSFVEQPLIDAEEINRRLEALEELNEKPSSAMRSGNISIQCMTWSVWSAASALSLQSKRYGSICVLSGNDSLY